MKNVKRALVFDEPLMSLQDVRAFVVRDRLSPNWVLADGTEMSVQFHEWHTVSRAGYLSVIVSSRICAFKK